jgi:diguanylate cyclase (GGDEF)-like protein
VLDMQHREYELVCWGSNNKLVVRPIEHFISNMKDIINNNDISKRVLLNTKITEVKSIEEFFNRMLDSLQEYYDKLRELSDRDYLTKLYNRRKFEEFLNYEVHRSDRHKYNFCVVMIDLDNFKFINDTYGHAIGDLALKEVAQILSSLIRKSDVAARIGGDEFAIILPETNGEQAFVAITKVKDALGASIIELIEDRVHITASFGITEYPSQASSSEELMTCSDLAMYKAKRAGKNTVATVDTSDKNLSVEIFRKGEFIKNAIDEDRIIPFFQPIYDISTGKIFAYEVLARIEENGAFLSAGQFIEVAEELNLSQAIDQAVIKKGLKQRHEKAIDDCYFFFNISSKIFTDKVFINDIMSIVDKTVSGGNGRIVFEILEREAIPNIKEFIDMIKQLKEKNVLFALDDFGAGFSSFTYLKYFDVDFVKIDGEFIKNIVVNKQDEIFVRHINGICHEFGKLTIAEYIEDENILQAVKKIGINYAQGFYLGKPGHLE